MIKQADIKGILQKRADVGTQLSDWYNGISPDVKHTILHGLAGAAIGGGITGGIAAATPQDPEERHGVMRSALLGALLGGTAGAALPLGIKTLTSGVRFSGESKKPAIGHLTDSALHHTVFQHPGMTGLGLLAGIGKDGRFKNIDAWIQYLHHLKRVKTPANNARPVEALHRMTRAFNMGKGKNGLLRPTRLAILPAALGAGWLIDKYYRGEY